MTRDVKWNAGSSWVDTVPPFAIGALCGLIVIYLGGPFWTLLAVPALCCVVWQLARRLEGGLVIRVLLVTALAVAILLFVFLSLRVDTARLQQAVAQAGIEVDTVTGDRHGVVVSIRPASWGSERNQALRAVFAAAHTHAKLKRRVSIRWGDAMISTVEMKDVKGFLSGHITYREMLNRLDWSGTPDILPDDSSGNRGAWLTYTQHPMGVANGYTGTP